MCARGVTHTHRILCKHSPALVVLSNVPGQLVRLLEWRSCGPEVERVCDRGGTARD